MQQAQPIPLNRVLSEESKGLLTGPRGLASSPPTLQAPQIFARSWKIKHLPLELPGVEYWEVSRNFRGVGRFVTSIRGIGEASFTRVLEGKVAVVTHHFPQNNSSPTHATPYHLLSILSPFHSVTSNISQVYFQWSDDCHSQEYNDVS